MNGRDTLLAGLSEPLVPEAGDFSIAVYLLLASLLLLLVAVALWQVVRYRRLHWRREALRLLADLRERLPERPLNETLAEASILTRRLALTLDDSADNARLTGEDWLRRLDRLSASNRFTRGHGRLLLDAPYRADISTRADDVASLLDEIGVLARQARATSSADTGRRS